MLIGEVARRSGVSARMLRHYDALGLVRPSERTSGGYRSYSGVDIRRILAIESLRSLGLSLREAGRALDDPGFDAAGLLSRLIERSRRRIAAEQELLDRLTRIEAAEPADWPDVLGTIALLRGLGSADSHERLGAALRTGDDVGDPEAGPRAESAIAEALLAESDTNVSGALRWALAQRGMHEGAGVPEAVVSGLGATDPAVRLRAVQAIAEIVRGGVVPPSDASATFRPEPAVPEQTGSEPTGDDPAGLLVPMLADPSPEVRSAAALALATAGRGEGMTHLVDMIVAGDHDVDAAEALGTLTQDEDVVLEVDASREASTVQERTKAHVVSRLRDALGGAGDDPAVRRRVAQALAEVPGASARSLLVDLCEDEEPGVAHTARFVLAEMGDGASGTGRRSG